jgi:hypothetical protein
MSEPGGVMDRLERLERENRRLKRVGGAVLAALAALALMGQAGAKRRTVEAEEFLLTDANGKQYARLGVRSDGSPVLSMSDQTGKTRALLGATLDGTGLIFYDDSGKSRIGLLQAPDGAAYLSLADRGGMNRAILKASADGSTNLIFNGADGGPRVALWVGSDNAPALQLWDGQKVRARLAGESFTFFDQNEKVRVAAAVDRNGWPLLVLQDAEGKPAARLHASPDGTQRRPALVLYDRGGTAGVVAQAFEGGNTVGVMGAKGNAIVSLEQDGSPRFSLEGGDGKVRAALRLGGDGTTALTFVDPAGKGRVGIGVRPDGAPIRFP